MTRSTRHPFALLVICAALAPPVCGAPSVPLEETGIATLQAEMATGHLTSRGLVEYFLARIEAFDRNGPHLNAMTEINPEALAIADRLDAERREKGPRGPLHGIPVLIKDNIDTADAMLTTAGSLALVDSHPQRDAFIVKRLREAGAVILGKTNLSEWANFRSSRSSSGWSGRVGQTHNPYDPLRNPCGSSSGSGAAIAAGFAVVAVGTETDGSVVCPAAINGLVGLKPTVGLVSRTGIVPISASQDTAGPMARTVADAAVLLSALAGPDTEDAATVAGKAPPAPDYVAALSGEALKGVRIGVARNLAGFHEGVDAIFEAALAQLRAAGAELVDPADLRIDAKASADEFTVLLYEFKDGMNRYLKTRVGGPQSLAELITFNEAHRDQEMPYFGQEIFQQAQAKGDLREREYRHARDFAQRAAGRNGIDAVLKKYRLSAIVAPTGGPAWSIDLVNGDHFVGGESTSAAAIAGYPHITVPAGFLHGLPVGVSFIGAAWSEATLLGVANAFEQASHARHPPDLKPGG